MSSFFLSWRRVLAPALVLALVGPAATPARAAASTALPADVLRLLKDLKAIPAEATITDEQKQALAADLTALASGVVKPSAASLEQLADDLAAAAASGKLTHKIERLLAQDLAAVLNRTALDPAALRTLVAEIHTILAAYGIDDADLQALAADLETILDDFQTDTVSSRHVINLQSEGLSPFLLMNYRGRAKLVTVRTEGRTAQTVLTIDTFGLPPANPFTVAVTRRSDGTPVVLGLLKVRNAGREVVAPHDALAFQQSTTRAELDTHGETVFGGIEKPFPDGFDPTDIDTITLTDGNGTERLTGSFTDATDLQVHTRLVNWRVDAGAADAQAAGAVSFRLKTTDVASHEAFLLYVGGLPASAPVTLLADGVAVGTFTTTTGGRLVILDGAVPAPTSLSGRMLPVNALPASVDLDTLSSLMLTDASGNVLATAGM